MVEDSMRLNFRWRDHTFQCDVTDLHANYKNVQSCKRRNGTVQKQANLKSLSSSSTSMCMVKKCRKKKKRKAFEKNIVFSINNDQIWYAIKQYKKQCYS